jgi:Flp pilus assembly pilin Flp
MMRALLRRFRSDESGLSMTELLVAMFLTLIILAMVGNFFLSTAKITLNAKQNRNTNDVASNVINEVTDAIRVSTDLSKSDGSTDYAILDGSTRSKLIVYTLSNTSATSPAPSKITFDLLGTAPSMYVQETRCPGSASGSVWVFTSPCTVRNLGVGVIPPDSATDTANQLFTYRDSLGAAILIGTGKLSDTQRDSVAAITVTVRALAEKSTTPSVIMTNTVVLRNLGLDTAE